MKITLCGSMKFAKDFKGVQKTLEKMGHEVIIPQTVDECISNPMLNEDVEFCIKKDVIKVHHKNIAGSDAVLILNFDKGNIKNYIGASAFMEMGFAHVQNKKIFLLNDVPDKKDIRYSDEIRVMQPIILNGDLSKIGDIA